jgi:hypothetical protein
VVGIVQAQAVNITPLMENECQWDYHNFCSQYAVGSQLLDLCFKQNGRKLSKGCVEALSQRATPRKPMWIARKNSPAARDQTSRRVSLPRRPSRCGSLS